MPDDLYRLAVTVTRADGTTIRWGGDEPDARNVPQGITFGTTIPGGYKDASLSLSRPIDIDSPDLNLYDTIKIYGPGGDTAWEGRVAQLPRQHADQYSIQVGCVGWQAHLTDNPAFQMVYVDRDLAGWQSPSITRQTTLGTGNYKLFGTSSSPDLSGRPAVVFPITDTWASPQLPIAEALYDAGPGNLIGAIYYSFQNQAKALLTDPWSLHVGTAPDDTLAAATSSANLWTNPLVAGTYTPTTPARYGWSNYTYTITPAGVAGTDYSINAVFVVYGDHGLAIQGGAPGGIYASDVIPDILARAAPLLNYTTGTDGTISNTSYPIPQLAFKTPTTAADAISLVNGYHLYDWAVWDDKTFYYQQPDPSILTWEARLSDGAQISLEGEDATNVYNGVFVTYNDPAGTQHTVGPPTSNAEVTDASLADTSSSNPVNAHGIPVRWAILNISQTTTSDGAITLGAVYLAEHSLPQRRGQITLRGTVTHPTKGKRPVYEVRAGDWITITDRGNYTARKIVETRYDNDTRTCTCSLDNTAYKIEALLERLGVSLVGVL